MKEFHLQWHITSRCNLRCAHCYQDNFSGQNELPWPDLKSICDNLLKTMKMWDRRLTVALTGGEPFLKSEIWDIIDYLSASRYVSNISVITNGTIIDKYFSGILKHPILNDIYVSLDGISPESNDSIRGNGIFNKVISNIKTLKSRDLSVFIMFTLLKRNIKDAERLLDLCESLRVNGCILERFIPLGQSKKIRDELISPKELNRLYETIFNQCGLEYSREEGARYHALKVEREKGRNLSDLYGAECVIAKDGCALLPDGTVLPCRRFFHPIGNLLTESLDNIWTSSEVLNKIGKRENLEGTCRDCGIDECRGCRALAHALTGNYLSEDPLCRLVLQK